MEVFAESQTPGSTQNGAEVQKRVHAFFDPG